MRIAMLALAGGLLFAAPSAYAADLMAMTYGNTVTTKNLKTGNTATLLFDAGGIYTTNATGADGKPIAIPGKWTTKDGGATLCLTPTLPAGSPGAGESCSPLATHPVGEHWTVTDTAGTSFDVVVTAGR